MSGQSRYPSINIRSKNELSKQISDKKFSYKLALSLINDVLKNFDKYWYDSKQSEPEKNKFVRSAKGTPLGYLLNKIDKKVLAPHDHLIPNFIFGGLSGKSHIQAAHHLLGNKKRRRLLGLDIKHFFEQISKERVFHFLNKKCGCSTSASHLLANICCVPLGPKDDPTKNESIARGFATSPRLSIWCNLDIFLRLSWKVKKLLKGHDPKLSIFVDDIGITASNISSEKMEEVSSILENILLNFDPNQKLPINLDKKKNCYFPDGVEHLGLRLGRKKLSIGGKTKSRLDKTNNALKKVESKKEKFKLLNRKKAYYHYKKQLLK
jgi:hypothetical protein